MAHLDDLWTRRDPATGKRVRTERYGRGRRWLARYADPDGRRRSHAFDRKTDGELFLTTVEADKLRGVYVDPDAGRVTFRTYAAEWASVQVHRDATEELYAGHLKNHILPALGDRPLVAVKRSAVQGFVKGLAAKGLAPSTIEVVYGLVASIFRAAVDDDRLPRTPCRNIDLPERIDRQVTPIPLAAALALPSAVTDKRYTALILVTMSTGLRQGEAFGLQLDRVDFLRRQVRVDAQRGQLVIRRGHPPRIAPPKTRASARVIPLPDVALDALAAHVEQWPPYDVHDDGCARGRCAPGCLYGLVFTTARGNPLRRSVFNPKVWHPAVAAVGLPAGTGFHELRHFYASVLIDGGESVKVVQSRLGHKDANETLNTYAHLWPDSEDRTRAVVEAALRGDVVADALGLSGLASTTAPGAHFVPLSALGAHV